MKVFRKILKNGIRAVIIETDSELVSINVTIGAGGRYENPEIFGISHFLEHMVFKGTKKYPTAKILSEVIESVGGTQNAWTSEEYTSYWCRVPKKYFELAIDTLYEQVAKPLLKEKEILQEKGVIISEIRRNKDNPDEYLWTKANEIFWPKQNIASDILGPEKNIKKFTRKDFVSYKNKYYVGNNISISVVGGIKQKNAFKLLEEIAGKIPPGKKVFPSPIKENQKSQKQVLISRENSEQALVVLGYKAFSYLDNKKDALNVLMAMLGEGMSSILFREVREKRGLAYTVWAGTSLFSDSGIAVCYAGVNPNKAEETIKVIKTELSAVQKGKFSKDDLARAKEYLKGRYLSNYEGTNKLSAWYGTKELLSPGFPDLKELSKKIEKVTKTELIEIANLVFVPERENIIILGPFKKDKKFARI